jgi:hypothetical protein
MNRYSSNLVGCIGHKRGYRATGAPVRYTRDYIRAARCYCFCRVKVNVVIALVQPSEEQVAV